MPLWLLMALVLGVVEGFTEFIPVSSTGHLILVERLLQFGGERAKTFAVFIQLGAVMAVVVAYRRRFRALADVRQTAGFAGARGLGMLLLTTLPAIVFGTFLRPFIRGHLFTPGHVAVGLGVGGLWMLLTERFLPAPDKVSLDELGWWDALWVGLFQCLSLWPGMSRSACTILGGMITGIERRTVTEYSFFAAVPMMAAACLFDLWRSRGFLTLADIPLFGLGFVVAFVSAGYAVRFLVRFLGRHTLVAFGWYRLAVAGLVFLMLR